MRGIELYQVLWLLSSLIINSSYWKPPVCWNGVLRGHFLGIKMEQFLKYLIDQSQRDAWKKLKQPKVGKWCLKLSFKFQNSPKCHEYQLIEILIYGNFEPLWGPPPVFWHSVTPAVGAPRLVFFNEMGVCGTGLRKSCLHALHSYLSQYIPGLGTSNPGVQDINALSM